MSRVGKQSCPDAKPVLGVPGFLSLARTRGDSVNVHNGGHNDQPTSYFLCPRSLVHDECYFELGRSPLLMMKHPLSLLVSFASSRYRRQLDRWQQRALPQLVFLQTLWRLTLSILTGLIASPLCTSLAQSANQYHITRIHSDPMEAISSNPVGSGQLRPTFDTFCYINTSSEARLISLFRYPA